MTTWVILGAGYTGSRLANRLVRDGHDVIVTRREAAAAASAATAAAAAAAAMAGKAGKAGKATAPVAQAAAAARTATVTGTAPGAAAASARGVAADLGRPETLGGLVPDGAIVVCTAPPGADPAGEIDALARAAATARRLVYVSSTGVYAPGGGAWVDESWPVAPVTRAGKARAAAEAALGGCELARTGRTVALRVAGIHGPGRGLVARIRAGTYRIVGDGRAHVSRIHVTDLVEAIVRAGMSAVGGAVNVADDDPAPIGEVADAVAAQLGLPPPPRVPVTSVDAEVAGMLAADRRIANRRMKDELGVVLRYPSWRSALGDAA